MIRFLLKSVWYFVLMVTACALVAYVVAILAIGSETVNQRIADTYHEMFQEKVR